jgi:hypothetical protein
MITDLCGIPSISVSAQPWVRYNLVTAHGSRLAVYFKHDRSLLNPKNTDEVICKMGDMLVEGYSIRAGKRVRLAGIGYEPEEGGSLIVGSNGKNQDGTDRFLDELIISIENTQEVV